MLPMDLCGRYRPRQSRERAMDLLRQVELEAHAGKLPAEVSGGQQQRVAIARALANDPPILVADEPTGRLDSLTAEIIFEIFLHLAGQGKTVVMVTHDLALARRASRLLYIRDGQLDEEPAHES
jgi:putative ABC transport system ATP-binding protein